MQLDPIFLQNYLDAIERQNTQYYGKGGKVVDFLAEVLKGESKKATKEVPSASRRQVLGIDPKSVPPGQVAVKETVTKAPKKGETSVTLEEVANIPMSRRDVMRLGAGQLGRGLIPQGALRSAMELVGEAPVGAIRSVAEGSGFPSTIPGVIAHAFRKGLDEDETLALLQ